MTWHLLWEIPVGYIVLSFLVMLLGSYQVPFPKAVWNVLFIPWLFVMEGFMYVMDWYNLRKSNTKHDL